jgi:hypothetical protein
VIQATTMNSAMASACFMVGSRLTGANQTASGMTTHSAWRIHRPREAEAGSPAACADGGATASDMRFPPVMRYPHVGRARRRWRVPGASRGHYSSVASPADRSRVAGSRPVGRAQNAGLLRARAGASRAAHKRRIAAIPQRINST